MSRAFNGDLWNDDPGLVKGPRGRYVAVSGNTGAGKSTLVEAVVRRARALNVPAVGVNERALHHPLLRLMFAEPEVYAFGVQLNFLLQRHMVLLRWLRLGHVVVIERSHLDDGLFMEQHFEMGHVTAGERAAYLGLLSALNRKIPFPDVFVCLDVKPEMSMRRLARSEELGERPREFPDEATKYEYVKAWYKRIDEFHRRLTAAPAAGGGQPSPVVLQRSAEQDTASLAEEVINPHSTAGRARRRGPVGAGLLAIARGVGAPRGCA